MVILYLVRESTISTLSKIVIAATSPSYMSHGFSEHDKGSTMTQAGQHELEELGYEQEMTNSWRFL
jgi:hypothetical protein